LRREVVIDVQAVQRPELHSRSSLDVDAKTAGCERSLARQKSDEMETSSAT
jgi:hypothetical protein